MNVAKECRDNGCNPMKNKSDLRLITLEISGPILLKFEIVFTKLRSRFMVRSFFCDKNFLFQSNVDFSKKNLIKLIKLYKNVCHI